MWGPAAAPVQRGAGAGGRLAIMLRGWRRLLACALLLWLPLHGGVALAAGLCASMRVHDVAAGAMSSPSAQAVAAVHGGHAAYGPHAARCEGHAGPTADAAIPADAAGAVVADAAADDGPCAHCAACQVQAAALPGSLRLQGAAAPGDWTRPAADAPPERAPDTLDRPPRPALA